MEALFYGAYLQVCEEIGMTPEEDRSLGSSKGTDADRALLSAWLASIRKDPDLGNDIRTPHHWAVRTLWRNLGET